MFPACHLSFYLIYVVPPSFQKILLANKEGLLQKTGRPVFGFCCRMPLYLSWYNWGSKQGESVVKRENEETAALRQVLPVLCLSFTLPNTTIYVVEGTPRPSSSALCFQTHNWSTTNIWVTMYVGYHSTLPLPLHTFYQGVFPHSFRLHLSTTDSCQVLLLALWMQSSWLQKMPNAGHPFLLVSKLLYVFFNSSSFL